ncbi:molybdopterin molybdotransferase MoeA [Catenuloplanes sp. NPDC051500]|uniref:molybdopterin molybdotransferase MoeA n=1 Tax=Catenuloplanes sp. NPDC051500 TaxID=3363959 RepID=UPI0037A6B683
MSSESAPATPVAWAEAQRIAFEAGRQAAGEVERVALADADGRTLAEPLITLTDLPPFPTSSIDGYAVRGAPPWRVLGRILAGAVAPPMPAESGVAIEVATGAMVPDGTEAILRTEDSRTTADGRIEGTPRTEPEWRVPGDEAARGEELFPAGTPVDPAVIGLAAHCGYDALPVRRRPRAAVLVFGDELLTEGLPGQGLVRDALGPALPSWLRRLGATVGANVTAGPVKDTLDDHVDAIRAALDSADLICTTGGTMRGPVDHLHPALRELGGEYLINTVAVRPGFPMLVARVPGPDGRDRFLAGLPGNPQSAIVALMSLVAPLLAGLSGREQPRLPEVTLGAPIRGRGADTHLALVRVDAAGVAWPMAHVGSSMLRGLAGAAGFAVIPPGTSGEVGARAGLVPLPLVNGERP